MSGARTLGFSLLLMAAACTRSPGTQAPQPLKPQEGPKAWISVDYDGGLLNRSLRANFQAEQSSYVMVGHMGGDGRIRVLFPESPDETGYIRAKKYYRTGRTSAHYDAIPSLFSYTVSPYRALGARHDSYDGRGHGYVFIIASRTPLKYQLLYDYAGWAELEMEGYTRHHDPRYAIRNFAEVLAGGARYTLKFANSFLTNHHDSYAARAWDCSVLNSLGMFGHPALWSSWHTSLLGFGMSNPLSSCGQSGFPRYAVGPVFSTVVRPPLDPSITPAPRLDRPGRRGLGPRGETTTRTTLTRVSPSMPRDGDREAFDRRTRRPSYGSRPGTTTIDSRTGRAIDRGSEARAERRRTESPSADRSSGSRSGSASSGSSSGSSTGSSSGASSSSGTRSNSQPVSSPSERRRPDSR